MGYVVGYSSSYSPEGYGNTYENRVGDLERGTVFIGTRDGGWDTNPNNILYAGVTPQMDKHNVIKTYVVNGIPKVQFYCLNDNEVRGLAAKEGGTEISSAQDAVDYLSALRNFYIIDAIPPNIPVSESVYFLDTRHASTYSNNNVWRTIGTLGSYSGSAVDVTLPTYNNEEKVFDFNSGDYMKGDSTALGDYPDGITIGFNVKLSSESQSIDRGLWGDISNEGFELYVTKSAPNIGKLVYDYSQSSGETIISNTEIYSETWYQIFYVLSGSNVTIYQNGVEVANSNTNEDFLKTNTEQTIGKTSTLNFSGSIQSLHHYKYALSEEEIKTFYYGYPLLTESLVRFLDSGNWKCYNPDFVNGSDKVIDLIDGSYYTIYNNPNSYNNHLGGVIDLVNEDIPQDNVYLHPQNPIEFRENNTMIFWLGLLDDTSHGLLTNVNPTQPSIGERVLINADALQITFPSSGIDTSAVFKNNISGETKMIGLMSKNNELYLIEDGDITLIDQSSYTTLNATFSRIGYPSLNGDSFFEGELYSYIHYNVALSDEQIKNLWSQNSRLNNFTTR